MKPWKRRGNRRFRSLYSTNFLWQEVRGWLLVFGNLSHKTPHTESTMFQSWLLNLTIYWIIENQIHLFLEDATRKPWGCYIYIMIFRRARVNYLFKTCKIFGVNESYKNKIIHCFFSFPLQLIRKILLYRFYYILYF